MKPGFVVVDTAAKDGVPAAGLPDPLFCKRGLTDHARHLADRVDADLGGATSCGGSGLAGYVPDIVEIEG